MTTTTLPLSSLHLSAKNVRQNAGDVSALAASIAAQGLLQNLIVSDNGDGSYGVDGGGRRLAALQLLAAQGGIAADFPVPVRIIAESERTAASLTENVQREAMHPADEFDAFKKLADEGMSTDRIADAFGVTPLVVERRLKMAAAAPSILAAFRKDEISTDQVIALCSTDVHELQEMVWERFGGSSWNNNPANLRRAVLSAEVTANDDRVTFIGGVDTYVAAGGEVRRDLFGGDGAGVVLVDVGLVGKLVAEKLEAAAVAVRAEGWGWVEIAESWDYSEDSKLGRLPRAEVGELPQDIAAQRQELVDARACAEKQADDLDRLTDEEDRNYTDEERRQIERWEKEQEQATAQIEAIDEAHRAYTPEVMALAGAVVSRNGYHLRIERARVKAADRKALAALQTGQAVIGGRETESAGRKSGDVVSDALRRSLLGHRNVAAQSVLASKPAVAKILQAVWAVHEIRGAEAHYSNGSDAPIDWCITDRTAGTRVNHPLTDEAGRAGCAAFSEMCAQAVAGLPVDDAALWDCLASKSSAELDALITYSVAKALSLSKNHDGLTAKVLDAIGFSMAEHFQPTAENYTGRVSKQLNIAALDEAGRIESPEDRAALEAMKKGELADVAAERLNGTGWVPSEIRTPAPAQPKAKPKAAKKAAAKKTGKQSS